MQESVLGQAPPIRIRSEAKAKGILTGIVYQALADIGGVGFLYHELIKPMVQYVTNRIYERHVAPIWSVLRAPKYKPDHIANGRQFYDKNTEIPHSVKDVAARGGSF